MVEQEKDDLLLRRTRHTNLQVPHSEFVTYDKYPAQNTDIIDTIVIQKYRNHNKKEYTEEETNAINDSYYYPKLFNTDNVYTDEFRVLRFDIEEPNIMISISRDYKCLLVSTTKNYEDVVNLYPIQMDELVGLTVFDQYPMIKEERKGVTLRVDNGEPCYSVIAEFNDDDTLRYVLGDDCQSILCGYWKDTGIYNSRNEIPNLDYYRKLDEDDSFPDYKVITNGKISIPSLHQNRSSTTVSLKNMPYVDRDNILSTVRKNILEGSKSYGSL